ncbi:UvrD-helicase domain-containing protein [Sphaerobacter thermophilus]|uniref:ATP-dependent helicase n=1 Tax=Sphaerobacter thermophilus TaxID=2057 RepID=UPI002355B6B0
MWEPSSGGVDLLRGLNEAQQRAVTITEGPVLVVAGPGSGKTRVLTHRVAYLIDQRGVSPWNILAVTFTNKAAREMRDRLEVLVGPERARQLTVGTFHALCVRILRRDGHLIGLDPRFTIYDDADQIDAVRQALKALNLDPKQFPPRPILSRISAAKSQVVDPARFAEQVETYWEEIVSRVYPRYQEILRRNRALDFDDLLVETVRLFDEQPDVLRRYQDWYRYILVDEYQDTNHVQYLLVHALAAGHRNLCVVGDPDQSIYGWRQADIRNILEFKRDFPDAAEVHLELNYRSTGVIVEAADQVIRANTQRIRRQLRTENPRGDRLVVREAYDETQEAQFVVGEIRRLVQSGRYRYRDIAVLYRTNAQSRPLEDTLIRADIPYQLVGGTRFYERREIKDALALLRLIANPRDAVSLQRVLANTPLGKGIGARTLQELERWSSETGLPVYTGLAALAGESDAPAPPVGTRPARLLADVYRTIAGLEVKSRSMPLSALFDAAVEQTGFAAQFQEGGDPEALERWENVLQLRNVLMTYDELPESEALEVFLEESALIADADTIDESGDQVTLITLHAAKGLEFPVVFLVGAEEGILPHARSMESEAQVEEERRLFYVGITRAKERLYITHTFRRTVWGRDDVSIRSRFVDAIPPELIETTALRTATPRPSTRPTVVASNGPAAPPGPAIPEFRPGMRVFHPRFGDGIVTAVRASRGDQEVTVEFKRHGQKRLLASLANLTVD